MTEHQDLLKIFQEDTGLKSFDEYFCNVLFEGIALVNVNFSITANGEDHTFNLNQDGLLGFVRLINKIDVGEIENFKLSTKNAKIDDEQRSNIIEFFTGVKSLIKQKASAKEIQTYMAQNHKSIAFM